MSGEDMVFLLKSLLSGGVAGMMGKSFVAPLDRVKILLQTQNSEYKDKGVLSSLGRILRREGLRGLYRGNGVQMLRIFPYGAIQFSSYEGLKRLMRLEDAAGDNWKKFAAGSLGGVCGVCTTYPLDTIRARLAFYSKGEKGYNGIMQTSRTILQQDGFKGLYKGLTPSILTIIPQSGLTFYFFEMLKSKIILNLDWLRLEEVPVVEEEDEEEGQRTYSLTVPGKLLAGGCAGALAQSVSYPLDVARRRMQLGQGSGLLQVLIQTYKSHGVCKGLYRGMSVNYIRAVPLNAVSFSVYESSKQFLGISTGLKISLG